ncbi:MAG: type I restriction endonuclease, partial [Paraglaciecola sp.]|nr:type I restriction endonuclease [Paraglaciecola sp.]
MINEQTLEENCLAWFEQGGWEVFNGADIAPDSPYPQRDDFSQVVLNGQLRTAFERINTHIPEQQIENCFDQFKAIVLKPESLDLITNNRAFH